MTAKFDNTPISGFTVLRNICKIEVDNIPNNNVRGVPSG